MDVILKFAALRPTRARDVALTLATESNFQRTLRDTTVDRSADDIQQIAQRFVDAEFVQDADQVRHGASVLALLDRLRSAPLPSDGALANMVRTAVNGEQAHAFEGDLARVRDSVLAAYLLVRGPDARVAKDLVRAFSVVKQVLSGVTERVQLEALLLGAFALPENFVRGPTSPSRGDSSAAQRPEDIARNLAQQINALATRHDKLTAAVHEIGYHAEDELDLSEAGTRTPLSDRYLSLRPREAPVPSPQETRTRQPISKLSVDLPASLLMRASAGRNVVLSRRALELVPDAVVETVRSLDLDPRVSTIAEMRTSLERVRNDTGQQLMKLSGQLTNFVGAYDLPPIYLNPRWALEPVDEPEAPPPLATAAPATHTDVRPLGIADLLLVRARVARYERSEVAAVENVLSHERLTHTLRRLDTSETTTTEERELTDLQSQTQSVAEQENGRTTVQAVGPGVGPLSAEGANTFAKNVTDQVSSSSTARVRRLAVERRLREREDTTEHLIDNATGQAGRYGVYQWLDKIYEARTYSYGSRLLYDIVVPEPAAAFREALSRPRNGLPLPIRPAPFKVSPEDLTLDNWSYYATGHHATGVDAPPPNEVIVAESFGKQAKDPFSNDLPTSTVTHAEARSTRLPKGYQAAEYRATILSTGFPAGCVAMSIGTKTVFIQNANGLFVRSGRLGGEREMIPVALDVTSNGFDFGVSDITVGIEIVCKATEELMSAWQVKVHGQILNANRRRFDEYAEAVATRDATARLVLQGLPGRRKAAIVHTEVKRAALAFLTGQSFAGFNATTTDAAGFPYPNAAATRALDAYIRFFEQAVEWDRLAYAFFPYFWGSQASWVSKLLVNEPDEKFASFLASGAARVVLPIRRGYEGAFERFLNTGAVPTTDELLDVGSPLWVSLVEELRSQDASEGHETAVDEPWEFRVATDLVHARQDGSMPRWSLSQGAWQDVADPSF